MCSDTSDRKEKPFETAQRRHCTRCQDESEKPCGIRHLTNISWRFFFSAQFIYSKESFLLHQRNQTLLLYLYISLGVVKDFPPQFSFIYFTVFLFLFLILFHLRLNSPVHSSLLIILSSHCLYPRSFTGLSCFFSQRLVTLFPQHKTPGYRCQRRYVTCPCVVSSQRGFPSPAAELMNPQRVRGVSACLQG